MRLRRIVWAYQTFIARRRLFKRSPEAATLAAQREEARRKHRNARNIERRQRALMNGLLKQ
jgi:hypothetical protein